MASVHVQSTGRGIAAMMLGVCLFAAADAIAKYQGERGFAAAEIVLMRYVFGLIPVVVALAMVGPAAIATRRLGGHVMRALCTTSSLAMFFWGLTRVSLTEAIVIGFASPLFITALSGPVLGERVGVHRWGAVLAGFAGVVIVIQPGGAGYRPAMAVILLSALVYAVGALLTRRLSSTETPSAIMTWTTLVSIVVALPVAALAWKTPAWPDLVAFAALGTVGGAAQFFIIVAFRNAPAAVVSPFEYFAIIWGALIGYLVWHDVPGPSLWTGAAVIVAAGAYITWRETRRRR